MRPRYIELKNFLSHHDEKVALEKEGFFYLEGASGIGKSSFIVDAMGYALFGPRAARAEKQEELRNWNYPDEPMHVRVDLEFDDDELLIIERGIDGKGNVYAVASDANQVELARGPAPVERLVRARLGGMNWRQFYAAFVARQKEITQLTDSTGSQRRDLVHAMLGVRELELAQKEATDRRKRVGVELETLIKSVGERTRDSVTEGVTAKKEAVKKAEDDLEQMKDRLITGRTMLEETLESLKPLRAAKQASEQVALLESSLESHKVKLTALEEALARHNRAKELLAEASRVEEDLRLLLSQLSEVRMSIDNLKTRADRTKQYQALLEQKAAAKSRLDEAKIAAQVPVKEALEAGGSITMVTTPEADEKGASSERLQARMEQITHERKRLRSEKEKRAKDMKMLEESGQCFTCERPLSEHDEREHVFKGISEIIAELVSEEEALDKEEREIEKLLPEIVEAEVARGSAERSLAKAEEGLERVEGDIRRLEAEGEVEDLDKLREEGKIFVEKEKALKEQEAAKQKQLGELTAAKRDLNPQLDDQIKALKKESSEAESKLDKARKDAVSYDKEKLGELEEHETRVRGAIAKLEGEQPLREASLLAARNDYEMAAKELESFGLLLDERENKVITYGRLTELVDLLDRFARKLAGEIRPALEEIGSEILTQISDGAHIALRIDDTYDITVQTQEGNWAKAVQLSGGEQVRANIALRMALTRLVSKRTGVPVQFLVLDEPLSSQDQGHVENILSLLEDLRQHYPQIFIISHVGDVHTAESVNYRLRFEKGNGADRIQLEYA